MEFLATYPWFCKKCGTKGNCACSGGVPKGTRCPNCEAVDTVKLGWPKGTTEKEKTSAYLRIAGIKEEE